AIKLTECFLAQRFFSHSFLPREAYTFWRMRKTAMTHIEVKAKLGNAVVSREHGEKMRLLLERAIANGSPPVVVDFAGMQITSVSFFDESFGVLAKKYGEELLREKVKF